MFCLATEIIGAASEEGPGAPARRTFTPDEVRRALNTVVGRSEADLAAAYCAKDLSDPASFVVPKMALLLAVMGACELPQVRFQPAIGSCAGILVSEDLYAQ